MEQDKLMKAYEDVSYSSRFGFILPDHSNSLNAMTTNFNPGNERTSYSRHTGENIARSSMTSHVEGNIVSHFKRPYDGMAVSNIQVTSNDRILQHYVRPYNPVERHNFPVARNSSEVPTLDKPSFMKGYVGGFSRNFSDYMNDKDKIYSKSENMLNVAFSHHQTLQNNLLCLNGNEKKSELVPDSGHVHGASIPVNLLPETCPELGVESPGYKCGGCGKEFRLVCQLHNHINTHMSGGSYIYDHHTRTAFPRCDTQCTSVQTDPNMFSEVGVNPEKVNFDTAKDSNTGGPEGRGSESDNVSVSLKSNQSLELSKHLATCDTNEMANIQDIEPVMDNISDHTETFKEDTAKSQELKAGGSDNDSYVDDYDAETDMELSPEEYKPVKSNKKSTKALKKKLLTKKHSEKSRRERKCKNSKAKEYPMNKSVQCFHCDKVFRFQIHLKKHLKEEHGDKKYPEYYCKRCRQDFKNEADYKDHKLVHKKGEYKCEVCHKVLTTLKILEDHMNVHSGVKPFTCDICDKKFRTKGQLNFHKKQYHSPTYIQQCEYCGKIFTCRYKIRDHIKYCLGIKPHKCDICGKGFIRSTQLIQHLRVHNGEKPFVCDECGMSLSNHSSLKKHKRIHTGEKPFKCDVCNMAFTAKTTMVDHKRTHTQDKRFSCTYCGRSFIKKWNLKTHIRQHTGETPYTCSLCGQGFKQNVLLRTHLQTHNRTSVSIDQGMTEIIAKTTVSTSC